MIFIISFIFRNLSRLPFSFLVLLGKLFGLLLFVFAKERKNVAKINLKLCFPNLNEIERNILIKKIFLNFGRSVLERSLLWFAPKDQLKQLIQFENLEIFTEALTLNRPIILFAPHFVGLDMAWTRLSVEAVEHQQFELISMYSHQKSKAFDKFLYEGRLRFNDESQRVSLVSRQESIKPILKALKNNKVFYYLPDLDYGSKDSIFVDFFKIPTATITGLSRLSRLTNAIVIPCVSRQLENNKGYAVKFYKSLDHFPSDDLLKDTQFMNHLLEEFILQQSDQYFWLHKRFKTRPEYHKKYY